MRLRRVLIIFVGLLLTGLVIHKSLRHYFDEWLQEHRLPLAATHSSVLNLFDRQAWLIYSRPPGADSLLAIFNAALAVPNQPACQLATEWVYGVAYEVRNSQGRTLRRGTFHFSTRLPGTVQLQPNIWTPRSSFDATSTLLPSMADQGTVDFSATPSATHVAFRMVDAVPEVSEVGLRLFSKLETAAEQRQRKWLTLPAQNQSRLAELTALPARLLSEADIDALMAQRWMRLGPSRMEGDALRTRRLFSTDLPLPSGCASELQGGLLVDAGFGVALPLPPSRSELRLRFDALGSRTARVELSWRGSQAWERRSESLKLTLPATIERRFPPGLLQLKSDQPLMLHVERRLGGNWQDATPERQFLATYRAASGSSLSYLLAAPGSSQVQPLRLDLRRAQQKAGEPFMGRTQVRLRLLDAQNRILGDQTRNMDFTQIEGERPAEDTLRLRSSAAPTLYLNAPGAAARLEIVTEAPIWAQLRSRPAGLPYVLNLPRDSAVWRDPQQSPPLWFLLEPQNAQQLQGRETRQLIEYRRLRDASDMELLAGRYAWQALMPEGRADGEALAVARDPAQPLSERAKRGLYREVTNGQVNLRAEPGFAYVAPRLIGLHAAHAGLAVVVDGQPVLSRTSPGAVSWLRLPSMPAGSHSLSINGSKGRWFINQSLAEGPTLQELFAWRLRPGTPLIFTAETDGSAQTLTVRLFYAKAAAHRLRLRLLGPAAPVAWRDSWTQRLRDYQVAPGATQQAWVLGRALTEPQLSGGERLVLPLGTDLPRGRYRFEVSLLEGPECLLNVYLTQPGSHNDERSLRSPYSQEP